MKNEYLFKKLKDYRTMNSIGGETPGWDGTLQNALYHIRKGMNETREEIIRELALALIDGENIDDGLKALSEIVNEDIPTLNSSVYWKKYLIERERKRNEKANQQSEGR